MLSLALTCSACLPHPRPDPRACVIPAVLLVPIPVPQLDGNTWRNVADLTARLRSHVIQREADVAVIRGLCKR